MFDIPEKIETKINDLNDKVNDICGYRSNDICRNIELLKNKREIVIGYRSSCGTTDNTQKIYRLWVRAVKLLTKNGIEIFNEEIKIGNAYATLSGGFWYEYRYFLKHKDNDE